MLNQLVSPITGIVNSIIKRVLPAEKISDFDRVTIENELRKDLEKIDWKKYQSEVEDRASARLLDQKAIEKGNAFTTALSALHRPIWSLGCFAIFAWTIISPQFGLPSIDLNEMHKGIMQSVIMFYFGGRSIEKVASIIGLNKK